MLCSISIRNFALIDKVDLELGQGLNILTGETGAGKSIVIGAVTLLLGGRASSDFIRTGEETAEVTGLFDISQNQRAKDALLALDMEPEMDGTLIIGREISQTGRNRCRINGRLVTLSALADLAPYLVDISGQHGYQSLSDPSRHLEFLDAFGKEEISSRRARLRDIYAEFSVLKKKLQSLISSEEERRMREEYLRFQMDEIDALELEPGEDEALDGERKVLSSMERLFEFSAMAHQAISLGDEGSPALLDGLGSLVKEVEDLLGVDPRLSEIHRLIETAFYDLQEASHQLRSYRDSLSYDSDRLAYIESRLDKIFRLRLKYGKSVDEILEYREKIEAEYRSLTENEEEIARLRKACEALESQLSKAAEDLSEARKRVAKEMESCVMGELSDLNMDKTIFAVDFSTDEDPNGLPYLGQRVRVGPEGVDVVEFLISPNPGEELRPLAKIASGGELSRIMLALKTILATADNVPTLIFDEIDAGIGGRTADSVAVKLADLSRGHQVICITHLPQIAAMANSHYLIEKEVTQGRTRTSLRYMDEADRIEELARMLGGRHISETTRKQALEMIERSRS